MGRRQKRRKRIIPQDIIRRYDLEEVSGCVKYYQKALYHDLVGTESERRYAFWLVVRPAFKIAKTILIDDGLEPDEAESEIFIAIANLFKKFDPQRSSLITYINNYGLDRVLGLHKKLKKTNRQYVSWEDFEKLLSPYEVNDDFSLRIDNILFHNKMLPKDLTHLDRYAISKMLLWRRPMTKILDLAVGIDAPKTWVRGYLRKLAGKLLVLMPTKRKGVQCH
jgi:hypothetical protein